MKTFTIRQINLSHKYQYCTISQNFSLTHSCLEIYLTNVVWTCHTFKNNFGMEHEFAKYSEESCIKSSEEQFSFKYLRNIHFVREISPKMSGSEWVKLPIPGNLWFCSSMSKDSWEHYKSILQSPDAAEAGVLLTSGFLFSKTEMQVSNSKSSTIYIIHWCLDNRLGHVRKMAVGLGGGVRQLL